MNKCFLFSQHFTLSHLLLPIKHINLHADGNINYMFPLEDYLVKYIKVLRMYIFCTENHSVILGPREIIEIVYKIGTFVIGKMEKM